MLYRLIQLTGPNTGQQLTVLSPSMTIGSGSDCNIQIADNEMANRHAQLEQNETGLLIRDLGTMHKILVNHHQVEQCLLKHGDEIEIGRTRFLVHATVRAEVDAAQAVRGVQRAGRPRRLMIGVYAAAGLALLYLVARPFLILPETSDDPQPDTLPGTNAVVVVPTTGTNRTAVPIGPVRTNSTQAVTTTQRKAPPVQGIVTNTALRNPVTPVTQPVTNATVAVSTPVTTTPVTAPAPKVTQAPPSTMVRVPVPAPGPAIRIQSVSHNKFPATDSYDEMRTLTISLQQSPGAEINAESVAVEVKFFDVLDRNVGDGLISPSKMMAQQNPIRVTGAWRPNQPKVVTATYTVPRGGIRRERFYGFTVRVFHAGVLQDQTCRPSKLKDFMPK